NRFVVAYRTALVGAEILPSSAADIEAVLELSIIQKALYEVRYELSHRPDWVSLPISALHRVLSMPVQATPA
ncbi:MAG TPA: hypothetical protein VGM78_14650, partial [Ilumatobacteraceae bacterium]